MEFLLKILEFCYIYKKNDSNVINTRVKGDV